MSSAIHRFTDFTHAVVSGIRPTGDDASTFEEYHVHDQNGQLLVQVPLHETDSTVLSDNDTSKPFGLSLKVNMAVKDNIAIAGLNTGWGHPDFKSYSKQEIKHAAILQALIDAGAVPVCTAETTAFSGSQGKTSSLNPRADGNLITGRSSCGPASLIASQPLLGLTIGSDSFGSMIVPAGQCGAFAVRPSMDNVSRNGVYGCGLQTVPGVFTRHPLHLAQATEIILRSAGTKELNWSSALPKTILIPEELTRPGTGEVAGAVQDLLSAMKAIGVEPKQDKMLERLFSSGITESDIHDAVQALDNCSGISNWRCHGKDFCKEYEKTYGEPFSDYQNVPGWPLLNKADQQGELQKVEEYESASKEHLKAFATKLTDCLFGSNGDTILLNIREGGSRAPSKEFSDYLSSDQSFKALRASTHEGISLSNLTGGPNFALPIGHTLGRGESGVLSQYPVVVEVLGPCDSEPSICNLIRTLHKNGALSEVKTGSDCF